MELHTLLMDGSEDRDAIVEVLLNAFRGQRTSGGVLFRNPRAQEVGTKGVYSDTFVFVDFEYDTIA
jgi:hypothetical protein